VLFPRTKLFINSQNKTLIKLSPWAGPNQSETQLELEQQDI